MDSRRGRRLLGCLGSLRRRNNAAHQPTSQGTRTQKKEDKTQRYNQPKADKQLSADAAVVPGVDVDQQIPDLFSLQLGPRSRLVYMPEWVAKEKRCGHVPSQNSMTCIICCAQRVPCPTTLDNAEIETLRQFSETLTAGYYIRGVYKVENMDLQDAYGLEAITHDDAMEEVYMYHGASFPTLANIIEEGFDLSACTWGVYVSNRSSYSFDFATKGTRSHSHAHEVRKRVEKRYLQLQDMYDKVKSQETPPIPLISEPPDATRAILICKVLVPQGTKGQYCKTTSARLNNYSTRATSQVCPHFLVHLAHSPA